MPAIIRFTQHDGNLVAGSIINAVCCHTARLDTDTQGRRIGWPKGANLSSYIFGSYFWVASEVLDVDGDTVRIVSDYYRINDELAPDGTHYYASMPLPTYYNLDQPDAQEIPLVYGVSEDVGVDGLAATNDFWRRRWYPAASEDYDEMVTGLTHSKYCGLVRYQPPPGNLAGVLAGWHLSWRQPHAWVI